jgi:2-oxoglutarate dehydrogenase E2 component (dihydrolipoamide succinyltransferase)
VATVDVKVPQLAESISEATLMEWKKNAGDPVEQDEILIEIETDKVVLEVPAPETGVLKEIVKDEGATVTSNDVIARVDTDAAGAQKKVETKAEEPEAREETAAEEREPEERASREGQGEEAQPAAAEDKLSPAVRKLVDEHDLDPSQIPGSGKGGRIVKGDVLAYLDEHREKKEAQQKKERPPAKLEPVPARKTEAPAPKPGERTERREQMSRLRRRVAERLVEAQRTAAILTTFNDVNMQPVLDLRSRYKERFEKAHGVRLGIMSFFVKASILALKRYPAVNAYIEGDEIVYHDYYDIGIAVGSERGLVVPVLRDAEQLSFADIESKITEFAEKAKSGRLGIEELSGGTFTITNGGVFGSLLSTPILNPPQTGILGMHRTQQQPVVVNGEIVIRPIMYVALSYDHRLIDGREAVWFLRTIKETLEEPETMLLEL